METGKLPQLSAKPHSTTAVSPSRWQRSSTKLPGMPLPSQTTTSSLQEAPAVATTRSSKLWSAPPLARPQDSTTRLSPPLTQQLKPQPGRSEHAPANPRHWPRLRYEGTLRAHPNGLASTCARRHQTRQIPARFLRRPDVGDYAGSDARPIGMVRWRS